MKTLYQYFCSDKNRTSKQAQREVEAFFRVADRAIEIFGAEKNEALDAILTCVEMILADDGAPPHAVEGLTQFLWTCCQMGSARKDAFRDVVMAICDPPPVAEVRVSGIRRLRSESPPAEQRFVVGNQRSC